MDDIARRARTWIARGQGAASITAWSRLMSVNGHHVDKPSNSRDVADLVGLFNAVPEWRSRLHELADLSDEWRAVVESWDRLGSDPGSIDGLLPPKPLTEDGIIRFVFVGRIGGPRPNWPTARARLAALDYERRVDTWIAGTDTGSSSRAIWAAMLGLEGIPVAHPRDPADLARCLRLLAVFPEWDDPIERLRGLSPEWSRIAASWAKIENTMLDEAGVAWERATAAPRTFELMKAVLQPKKGLF